MDMMIARPRTRWVVTENVALPGGDDTLAHRAFMLDY
jgi:hypothetical protein